MQSAVLAYVYRLVRASARCPTFSWVLCPHHTTFHPLYFRCLRQLYSCAAPHILIPPAPHCPSAPCCDLLNQTSASLAADRHRHAHAPRFICWDWHFRGFVKTTVSMRVHIVRENKIRRSISQGCAIPRLQSGPLTMPQRHLNGIPSMSH